MRSLSRGRLTARQAVEPGDLARAQVLRTLAFGLPELDRDAFDDICTHILIEEGEELIGCFRILRLRPEEVGQSYSAQYYDLGALRAYDGRMIEIGRFCMHPDRHHAAIVRIAWTALAEFVRDDDARILFGCSSFPGTQPEPFAEAFALLRQGHLAPNPWAPRIKAASVFPYASLMSDNAVDPAKAMRLMPPLLRSYLMMGGWVSDHAVVDGHMNTMHVFTGVEMRTLPPARARAFHLA